MRMHLVQGLYVYTQAIALIGYAFKKIFLHLCIIQSSYISINHYVNVSSQDIFILYQSETVSLPTTVIACCLMAVLKAGPSPITSHLNIPEVCSVTSVSSTELADDLVFWGKGPQYTLID